MVHRYAPAFLAALDFGRASRAGCGAWSRLADAAQAWQLTRAKTAWPSRCGNSGASNARSSSWTGSRAWNCAEGINAGLDKGEARNALACAVFFYRLGELRDHSFEQQRHRAGGLNLVTAALVLWNTVYLERAARTLRWRNPAWNEGLLRCLSPLGCEHINLTGDYVWRQDRTRIPGKFRLLRVLPRA